MSTWADPDPDLSFLDLLDQHPDGKRCDNCGLPWVAHTGRHRDRGATCPV